MWKTAQRAGLADGRDQVEPLMRICGITGARRGRRWIRTTERDELAEPSRDLIGWDWSPPNAANQLWGADFT